MPVRLVHYKEYIKILLKCMQSTAVHPVQGGAKAVCPVQGPNSLVLCRPHPLLDGRDDWSQRLRGIGVTGM